MSGSSFRTLFTLVLTARLQQAGAPLVGAGTGFTHQVKSAAAFGPIPASGGGTGATEEE